MLRVRTLRHRRRWSGPKWWWSRTSRVPSAEWVRTFVGSINAQIRPRVSGHLVSQNYKEGAVVKAGDLLFQVDRGRTRWRLTRWGPSSFWRSRS